MRPSHIYTYKIMQKLEKQMWYNITIIQCCHKSQKHVRKSNLATAPKDQHESIIFTKISFFLFEIWAQWAAWIHGHICPQMALHILYVDTVKFWIPGLNCEPFQMSQAVTLGHKPAFTLCQLSTTLFFHHELLLLKFSNPVSPSRIVSNYFFIFLLYYFLVKHFPPGLKDSNQALEEQTLNSPFPETFTLSGSFSPRKQILMNPSKSLLYYERISKVQITDIAQSTASVGRVGWGEWWRANNSHAYSFICYVRLPAGYRNKLK